jgi:hypothetical protein
MTIQGREAAERGCLECSNDHHHICSRAVEDDAGGCSTVYCCCCGLAVDAETAAAEYAAYAEELRRRGWTQPAAGPGLQPEGSG